MITLDLQARLPFADRRDAGRRMAPELAPALKADDPIVLALPRGGVPVAYEIATVLHAPLDVLIVRKVGHPMHEEYAVGAIASGGIRVLDEAAAGVDPAELEAVIRAESAELQRRESAYRGDGSAVPLAGRAVVLVDDGIATGATMEAAARAVRAAGARKVAVVAPVASAEAAARLQAHADLLVVGALPEHFVAVGRWYRDFPQCSDAEVLDLLRRHRASHALEAH